MPPLGNPGSQIDGVGQMQHFASADKMNIFRLPVAWQFLVQQQVAADLDPTNSEKYDELVQGCLKVKAHCIIDIHNYARWDGQIIGSGAASVEDFAHLWSQLAKKYANEDNIVFGIMNEPHDSE